MKKHLLIVCLAYFYMGFAIAIEQFGHRAGLSGKAILAIWVSAVIVFFAAIFTSLQKLTSALDNEPKPTQP
jgi:hypothetical protein